MIVPAELLPHLLAKDVISDGDKENILREDYCYGNFAAAVLLLDRITRKHRNWYTLFIEALTDANMEDVAADLQIPELLENPRTKVTDAYASEDDNPYSLTPFPRREEVNFETSKRIIEHGYDDNECVTCYSESSDHYYEDNLKPPLPPRIPINKKRKVPLPNELYCSQNSEIFAEMYTSLPTSNTEYSHNHVTEEIGKLGKESDEAVYKFKDMLDDIEKMKMINNRIRLENCFLEKKSEILREVNYGLKRRRQLHGEIAMNEKERKALQSDTCQEDTDDENYKSGTKISHDVNTQASTPSTSYMIKRTPHYSIPSFTIDSPLPTVPINSTNVDRTSIVSQRFERDSGMDCSFELG